MASFIGIDVGTSSVKVVLVNEAQELLAEASRPVAILRPRPLWAEQDPAEWWTGALACINEIREKRPLDFRLLAGVGLSGQQHSATLLDAENRVLRPTILWNDGRCGAECRELIRRMPDFTSRAGNVPMPGFTAPKLLWVARHEPEIFARIAKVLLPKDMLRWHLTGGYVSDMSDSSGTLWMDIAGRRWDEDLIRVGGMRRGQLPDLVEGSEVSGMLRPDLAEAFGLGDRKVPVAGGGGDNASSAVGIGAVRQGEGFLSLGTSGVIFASTDHKVALPERTLHGFCHALPGKWHGMTVVLSAAAAFSWIANILGRGNDIAGLTGAAMEFAADPGRRAAAPIFLPYISGERTPHNDPDATGVFSGLRSEHGPDALAYAVLEGVAFALADCLDVMDAGKAHPQSCMLVGGGSRSSYWGQLIADSLGLDLDLPVGAEVGAAFGAARLGMLAAGAGSIDDICVRPPVRSSFAPNPRNKALLAARRETFASLYSARR